MSAPCLRGFCLSVSVSQVASIRVLYCGDNCYQGSREDGMEEFCFKNRTPMGEEMARQGCDWLQGKQGAGSYVSTRLTAIGSLRISETRCGDCKQRAKYVSSLWTSGGPTGNSEGG